MQQTVMVIEAANGEALVRGRRASSCGSCAGKASCGTLGSWVERFAEMRVANPLGAKPGDEVTIEVSDGEFLRAALRLYGAPMLGFFVAGFAARAAAIATGSGNPEVVAALAAIAGMGGVFLWLRLGEKQRSGGARIVHINAHAIDIPVVTQNG